MTPPAVVEPHEATTPAVPPPPNETTSAARMSRPRKGEGTWERYSPKKANSPKHQPDAPSPRTAPVRTPVPVEALDPARMQAVVDEAIAALTPRPDPKHDLLPKTALGRIYAKMQLPYRVNKALNHLLAIAGGKTCKAYASYRFLALTDEHERQLIANVGLLEAYDTVDTVLRWQDGEGRYYTAWAPGRTQTINEFGLVLPRWIIERLPAWLVKVLPRCILPRALREPAEIEADRQRWEKRDEQLWEEHGDGNAGAEDVGAGAGDAQRDHQGAADDLDLGDDHQLTAVAVLDDAQRDQAPAQDLGDAPRDPVAAAAAEDLGKAAALAVDHVEQLDQVGPTAAEEAQRDREPAGAVVDEARALFDRAAKATRALSSPTFDQWFSGVQFESLDTAAGLLTLRAANEFVQEWVRKHFDALREQLAKILDRPVEIAWTFGDITDPVAVLPALPPPRPRPIVAPATLAAAPSTAMPAPFRPAAPPRPLPADIARQPEVATGAICDLLDLCAKVYRYLPREDAGATFAARIWEQLGESTDGEGRPLGEGHPLAAILRGLWECATKPGRKGSTLADFAVGCIRSAGVVVDPRRLPRPVAEILERAGRGETARGPPVRGPPA